MSHGKVREEKTCLNCSAPVPGRFCANCGQENIEPKQTVWHLVNHFFSDVTHFDGKFFVTVKDLFRKPGFLSTEYVKGRRVSYLDPIRMYIFTSAFFFLIFFSIVNLHDLENKRTLNSVAEMEKARNKSLSLATNHGDSVALNATFDALETKDEDKKDNSVLGKVGRKIREKTDSANRAADSIATVRHHSAKDSVRSDSAEAKSKRGSDSDDDDEDPLEFGNDKNEKDYKTLAAYDSAQAALPPGQRHRWLKRIIKRKIIETNEKWHNDHEGMWREWAATFVHNFPKMLFISLPLFALLLKLLYVRRKQFYYVDHGIFSVHLYIYSFLILLVFFGLQKLHTVTGYSIFTWLEVILFLYPIWYYYKSMRNFYCQGRGKTLLKYFTLLMLSFVLQMILFAIFFLFSIAQV